MHMVPTLADAERAAAAGADVIVAQGTEGGGHVGLVASTVIVPQVARAVAPVPVLAAGGFADGAGLAAALMLGADGVLFGTRFLATIEAPVTDAYKQVLVAATGTTRCCPRCPISSPGPSGRVLTDGWCATASSRCGPVAKVTVAGPAPGAPPGRRRRP